LKQHDYKLLNTLSAWINDVFDIVQLEVD